MMNINLEHYYRAMSRDTGFFGKWHHKRWHKYYNKWLTETTDIINWGKKHPIKYWWIKLPQIIEGWFIYGFKIKYDKSVVGHWTWIERYHLHTKLVRYKTWQNYRITWWDKIRFYLVTGYKFVNE